MLALTAILPMDQISYNWRPTKKADPIYEEVVNLGGLASLHEILLPVGYILMTRVVRLVFSLASFISRKAKSSTAIVFIEEPKSFL